MSMVFGTNTELLGTYSELNGSSFIVRTRRTLNKEKLLIDITELYHDKTERPSPMYLVKLARSTARRFGAESVDYAALGLLFSTRKVSDASGTLHPVNVIRQTFVFTLVK